MKAATVIISSTMCFKYFFTFPRALWDNICCKYLYPFQKFCNKSFDIYKNQYIYQRQSVSFVCYFKIFVKKQKIGIFFLTLCSSSAPQKVPSCYKNLLFTNAIKKRPTFKLWPTLEVLKTTKLHVVSDFVLSLPDESICAFHMISERR